jgi:hypothetical protein
LATAVPISVLTAPAELLVLRALGLKHVLSIMIAMSLVDQLILYFVLWFIISRASIREQITSWSVRSITLGMALGSGLAFIWTVILLGPNSSWRDSVAITAMEIASCGLTAFLLQTAAQRGDRLRPILRVVAYATGALIGSLYRVEAAEVGSGLYSASIAGVALAITIWFVVQRSEAPPLGEAT